MRRLVAALVLLLAVIGAARADIAVDPSTLAPAQERRAQAIMHGLRCLVCQNESIADSNADLARDLRGVVRQRVAAGDSDDAVRAFLVARYGDWVLLDPPFKAATLLLWLSPLLVLLVGGVLVARRRRAAGPATLDPVPLSAEEARLLAEALADRDETAAPAGRRG